MKEVISPVLAFAGILIFGWTDSKKADLENHFKFIDSEINSPLM